MRVLIAVTVVASALLAAGPALAQDIKGQGRVIDDLRLWVGHTKVRLCGLTSAVMPAMLGRDGAPLKSLGDLTQNHIVECIRVGNGTSCDGRMPIVDYGHVVAQCFVDGVDVVSLLICSGNRQPAAGCRAGRAQLSQVFAGYARFEERLRPLALGMACGPKSRVPNYRYFRPFMPIAPPVPLG